MRTLGVLGSKTTSMIAELANVLRCRQPRVVGLGKLQIWDNFDEHHPVFSGFGRCCADVHRIRPNSAKADQVSSNFGPPGDSGRLLSWNVEQLYHQHSTSIAPTWCQRRTSVVPVQYPFRSSGVRVLYQHSTSAAPASFSAVPVHYQYFGVGWNGRSGLEFGVYCYRAGTVPALDWH